MWSHIPGAPGKFLYITFEALHVLTVDSLTSFEDLDDRRQLSLNLYFWKFVVFLRSKSGIVSHRWKVLRLRWFVLLEMSGSKCLDEIWFISTNFYQLTELGTGLIEQSQYLTLPDWQ